MALLFRPYVAQIHFVADLLKFFVTITLNKLHFNGVIIDYSIQFFRNVLCCVVQVTKTKKLTDQ